MSTDLAPAATACINHVRIYNHVTFIELQHSTVAHDVPISGEHAMEFAKCPNLLLWAGMSAVSSPPPSRSTTTRRFSYGPRVS